MSNKREVADIKEEWQVLLNNAAPRDRIPLNDGWLAAAMSQIWEYVDDLETDIVDLLNDANARVKENWDLEEKVATLELETDQAQDKLQAKIQQIAQLRDEAKVQ